MAGSRRAGKLPRPPTRRSPPAHGGRGRCALGAPPSAAVSVGPCPGRSVGPSPAAGGAAAGCPPRADTRALARPEVNTRRWPTRKRPRAARRPAARGTPGDVVRDGHTRVSRAPVREPRTALRVGASEAALTRQINALIRDGDENREFPRGRQGLTQEYPAKMTEELLKGRCLSPESPTLRPLRWTQP